MKIAILTNAFPPDGRGGAERVAWLQATGLASRGHQVKVWAPAVTSLRGCVVASDSSHPHATTQPRNHATDSERIEVTRFASKFCRLGSMNVLARLFFHLFTDLGPNYGLVYDILEWKPDAIISHNLTGCGIGTPQQVKKRGNIPLVHIMHDIQLTDPSGQIRAMDVRKLSGRAWRAFWSRYRGQYFFGVPTVLASPTEWLLTWHRNYGFKAKAYAVLPNPVDITESGEHTCTKPATILYVGRLTFEKGFHHFLDAIQYLDEEYVSGVVVLGDGPLAEVALDIKDDRIECMGWREPEDVRLAIRNAGILIAPSEILENQQTVIVEAMAEGTPVIATDVGGTRETLEGTKCPVLSPSSNLPVEIANAVRNIVDDQKTCRRLSRAMRERAQRHDLEHYVDMLFGMISK